jgi:type VI secretion system protein ImpH
MSGAADEQGPRFVTVYEDPAQTAAGPVPAPAPETDLPPSRQRSLLQNLIDEPARFSFDAAIAVLMHAAGQSDPGDAVRFHATPGLGFVAADVMAVEPRDGPARATIGLIGLSGPSGVLPRPYTETVNAEHRHRSAALGDFLDILAQRPIAQFARAGMKYRPHRAADAASLAQAGSHSGAAPSDNLREALLALTGYGTPHLTERLPGGPEPLLFYAGLFAARPRSADRLAALLSDWLGETVEVEQFAGTWRTLGADQMSRLPSPTQPGMFHSLGVDAAIGSRAWDVQSRIMLHIGPLDLAHFNALLPDGPLLARLTALARAFLEYEIDFAVNPVLDAAAVPSLELTQAAPPRLGWNSWLPMSGPRQHPAADAVFEADLAGPDVAAGAPVRQ